MYRFPLFPYWKFIIHSPLSHQQALARLSGITAPFQWRFSYRWDKPEQFMGTVSTNEFRIRRILQYRNSFAPTIYGRFLSTQGDLQIQIIMRLNPIMLVMCLGMILVAFPLLYTLVYQFSLTHPFDELLKRAALVMAFLYFMFTGGFSYEAVRSRRLLNNIFDA